ncbi:MAG: aldo/keto reductase, partial [Mycoplasma sp.]|nr:aldo/keto reductase [Mycoplasma sp.]
MKYIQLNKENKISQIGLGTWMIKHKLIERTIENAINLGYTAIDTAQIYKNEHLIGNVLSKVDNRDKLFITTKIWVKNYKTKEKFFNSIKESLKKLNLDYVDLLL